ALRRRPFAHTAGVDDPRGRGRDRDRGDRRPLEPGRGGGATPPGGWVTLDLLPVLGSRGCRDTVPMRNAHALRTFLAVFAATAVVASAGAASIHPTGLPVTLTLPSGWSAGGATKAAVFNASGRAGHLAVTKGGSFPQGLPFALFLKTETSAAAKAYKGEDAHAV